MKPFATSLAFFLTTLLTATSPLSTAWAEEEKSGTPENESTGAHGIPDKPDEATLIAQGATVITSDQQADFDSRARKAVFLGNVEVKDPEFHITCDKLTAYTSEDDGGLERAIAEGNVRVIQEKRDAEGKVQRSTGKGKTLIWEAKSGVARLSGGAQVQQGINLHIAEGPDTVMILTRDGELTTQGRSRTVLKPEE